jgi:hypothetical protein
MVGWLVNNELERLQKKAVMAQLRYYPDIWLNWGKPWKASVGMNNAFASIRTKNLPDINLECYCYTKLLDNDGNDWWLTDSLSN